MTYAPGGSVPTPRDPVPHTLTCNVGEFVTAMRRASETSRKRLNPPKEK